MKQQNKRTASILRVVLAATLSAALAACGGGDDSSEGSLSAANGRWIDGCLSSVDSAMRAGTNTFLSLGGEFEWQARDGKLVGTQTIRVYEATDCSGTALATLTSPVEVTDRGTTTVNGKTATKVDFFMDAPMAGFSAPTITINQVTFVNDKGTWTEPKRFKDLIYVEGDRLFTGNGDAPVGADGYPTTLDLTPASALVRSN